MDHASFYDAARKGRLLGPTLSAAEVEGLGAILDAMGGAPLAWTAYALATAYHETWHTMQPISESGTDAYFFRMYDPKGNRPRIAHDLGNTQPGDGVRFHGRGYVQLTGRANYTRAARELSLPLVLSPDTVLHDDVAAQILRRGMTEGWFTGVGFADFLPSSGKARIEQFVKARRIINGSDRATDVAKYADEFQAYLGG